RRHTRSKRDWSSDVCSSDLSFIRDADDVGFVLDTLEQIAQESADPERVRRLGIVLKIETIPAYEGLCRVLLAGMRHPNLGIMIRSEERRVGTGAGSRCRTQW